MRESTMNEIREISRHFLATKKQIEEDHAEAIASGDHLVIIRHFDQMRKVAEFIKDIRDPLKELEDKLSYEIVPDAMRKARIKTVFVEDVGRVTVSYRYSCSIIDDEKLGKQPAFDYLRSIEQGGLIKETVHSGTLSSFAKDWVENHGKELPMALFKTGTNPYTSITKK